MLAWLFDTFLVFLCVKKYFTKAKIYHLGQEVEYTGILFGCRTEHVQGPLMRNLNQGNQIIWMMP